MRSISVSVSRFSIVFVAGVAIASVVATAQTVPVASVHVKVSSDSKPIDQAEVRLGSSKAVTSSAGEATLQAPAGAQSIVVTRRGFIEKSVPVNLVAGQLTELVVELIPQPEMNEEVTVTATRSEKRIQDEPLRVEVLSRDEIEEKLLMTPGDIAMLLTETTGLRVQVTSPALGGASLRVQGLRGRYTQLLADGLPLYGGQSGSIGLLQIPPMDLGQVEVIKGVASSLFGSSALGGVVNLVSRRPAASGEREVLLNQTTQGGTNGVLWLSGPITPRWGYSLLGDVDHQSRDDIDKDGWSDIAGYRRVSVRPRLYWDNQSGRTMLLTAGTMLERRTGGTEPGHLVADGSSFPESLQSDRADGGVVLRWLRGQKIIGVRGSVMSQEHTHVFGDAIEHDRHATGFAETSLTAARGQHTVVIGGAVQSDQYRNRDVPQFDYTFWVPSVFAQDDIVFSRRVSASASARVDRHNKFGTFFSPRVSALVRLGGGWTTRASVGTGYFAPTPLTEDTEAAGLTRLAPFTISEAERARSYSIDLNRSFGVLDLNATAFGSKVTGTLATRALAGTTTGYELVALAGPTRTAGIELLSKIRYGVATLVGSYTYTHATEPDPETTIRGDVPLTPRHTAGLTVMWEREGRGRVGLEAYYTGRQILRDDPYRQTSVAYPYFGAMAERQFGRYRVFVNSENLTDRRQTRFDSLLRPARNFDGRWTVDAWAPLEGRVLNAGMRIKF